MQWLFEKVYYRGPEYFSDLTNAIRLSKTTIELETYIFDCDSIGTLILNELKSASLRGVQVRLVVDGFGAFFEIPKILTNLEFSAVQFRVFHPFFFPAGTRYKWLRIDLIIDCLSHWNSRLHRKICLVDGQTLFVGSFNITGNSNRETAVQVKGPAVEDVRLAFEIVWNRVRKLKLGNAILAHADQHSSLVRLNHSRATRKKFRYELCRRIASAKEKVWITNAYFVPPTMILKAIIVARKNGKDVTIVVPTRSEPSFMKQLTEIYYGGLLRAGVRIFEYQKNFLHAKSLLVDDWAIVGSSNINYRSLFHDVEVDVVMTHSETLVSLQEQFLVDCGKSVQITLETLVQRPWLDRVVMWFLFLLRGWM